MNTRKRHTPEQLGALMYEALRALLSSEEELSISHLAEHLREHDEMLDEHFPGEVMIGCMFAANLALERSTAPWVAERVLGGITAEFLNHLREQGATDAQVAEWETTLRGRFSEFERALDGYEGYEPPWRLGRRFLWFLTGDEHHLALAVKDATLFLLRARDAAQELVNLYGPTLEYSTPDIPSERPSS